jgi:hypothetical protein
MNIAGMQSSWGQRGIYLIGNINAYSNINVGAAPLYARRNVIQLGKSLRLEENDLIERQM